MAIFICGRQLKYEVFRETVDVPSNSSDTVVIDEASSASPGRIRCPGASMSGRVQSLPGSGEQHVEVDSRFALDERVFSGKEGSPGVQHIEKVRETFCVSGHGHGSGFSVLRDRSVLCRRWAAQ
jgi:hypothetical protein